MSLLSQAAADYIAIRRSLGFKFEGEARLVLKFVAFLKEEGHPLITTDLALRWATGLLKVSASTAARHLAVVRKFAEFVHALDPRNEVPPPKCLPFRIHRPLPYIYSEAELRALLEAARALRAPSFSRLTTETFIGLLAVTGMRSGEARGLDRTDFDREEAVVTIRDAKFGKSREVLLHPTTCLALRAYERARDRVHPHPKSPAFFLSRRGTRLLRQDVSMSFARVLRRAGLQDRKPRRPRIHDLRHSFAVHTMRDWYHADFDVEAQLPLLSTYLGHVSPSSTYWYLTATPELLGLAAKRLERAVGELP